VRKLILLSFSLINFLIPGCSSSKENTNVLINDIWALKSIEGKKIIIDEKIKNLPVLEIYVEEERVYGNTGCNTLNSKFDIDGNKIKFLNMVTTEIACPGDLEQKFLSALKKVDNYRIEKMRLYLFENEKELLTFRKID